MSDTQDDAYSEAMEEIADWKKNFDVCDKERIKHLAEIETLKAQFAERLREAFYAGWETRSQIIRTGRVKGKETVYEAWSRAREVDSK
jgi:hypothetical protein